MSGARARLDARGWVVLAITALLPRLIYALLADRLGPGGPANPDSLQYQALARELLAGHGWAPGAVNATESLFRPPLYVWFLAGLYALFGTGVSSIRVVQALLGAASALFVSGTAAHLFGRRAGWIAGLLFALNPLLILQTAELLTESLFIALYTATFYFFARALDGSMRAVCASGLLLGLAVLCRPTPLLAAPVLAAALWRGPGLWRTSARNIALFIVCVGAVTLPWVVRGAVRTGFWVPIATTGEFTLYLGNAPGWAERVFINGEAPSGQDWDVAEYRRIRSETPGWFGREARKEILRDLARFARLTAIRTGRFFKIVPETGRNALRAVPSLLGYTLLFPLGVVGLFWALRWRQRFAVTVTAVLLLLCLLHIVSIPNIRYRIALVDALLPIFAGGCLAGLFVRGTRKPGGGGSDRLPAG